MASLLLDTHIVLWLDSGDERLRSQTRTLIEECWRDGGTLLLSAVTAWRSLCSWTLSGSILTCQSRSGSTDSLPDRASSARRSLRSPLRVAISFINSSTATLRIGC